jgi:DNA-binding PadR family transcriptional regulator
MCLTITDAKREVLAALVDEPRHGYALATDLGTQGPTTYRHLRELADAGYLECERDGRRKVYSVTDRGRSLLEVVESEK